MTPASVPSTPGSALAPPSGRGRCATAGSGHATSAFSSEAEAAPLLWEAATPRTARARRVGDFLASTASGLALVLVLVALVATTPSQWADAVRGVVGGPSSASSATSPFADGAGVRLGNSTAAEGSSLAALGSSRTRHRVRRHRHATRELPEVDAFGERDAGMMDSSGQWLAQLEERAERQRRWQDRIARKQSERDRANGRPAPGEHSDATLPDAFAAHRAKKEAEWSEEIATLGLGRDRSKCLGPEHKMLACVTSYGDKDPRAINTLIANYADAHDRFGMDVDVVVWVSDSRYATFRTDWGPGVNVHVSVGDGSLGHDFAGLCRETVRPHLHRDEYTHYLVSENDINVTSSNMEALCREHRHLNATGRDDLHPMLVRYEDLVDKRGKYHRVVVDENYCNPPQVKRVEWHGGQRYVVPRNPYAAMFFLPAERYRSYVSKLERGIAMLRLEDPAHEPWIDSYWTKNVPYGVDWYPGGLVREWYSSFWFQGFTTAVIPMDTFGEMMVHHMDDGKYAASGNLPEERAFVGAARRWRGVPTSVSDIGYEFDGHRRRCDEVLN